MKNLNHTPLAGIAALGLVILLAFVSSASATTNVVQFANTTVAANSGPVNPANGAQIVYGTNLLNGDVVVVDCLVKASVIDGNDKWGSINLNQGGFRGLTAAALGVLARTGSGNASALFPAGSNFTGTTGTPTNRVRIELTATADGSTTNMNYFAGIDQNNTGTFTATQSGTATFINNSIALTFGAQTASQTFQNLLASSITVATPTPTNTVVPLGQTATFTGAILSGDPAQVGLQWRKNGTLIAGATNLTYTTPALALPDSGVQFSYVATNLLNTANVVTSGVATVTVRTTPTTLTFNFADAQLATGFGAITTPGSAFTGSQLLAGDTVVFDGYIFKNGAGDADGWCAVNINGSGYGNLTAATLGVLVRLGVGAGQTFINGAGGPNISAGGAQTNRLRIELYPSITGSTTNMGYAIRLDQNLSGTFGSVLTGTNLTFANNTLTLTFGDQNTVTLVTQNPQAVSIYSGATPATQTVSVGSPASFSAVAKGWSPAYQWRKNGALILNATNRSYTTPSLTLTDNGALFDLVVSNRSDSANVVTSAVATVSIRTPNNLTWYPQADFVTWDNATNNWTLNGGASQTNFTSGDNATFDDLGFNIGGSVVTPSVAVSANLVTLNLTNETYEWTGANGVSGQTLLLNGDGSGALGLETTASFSKATVAAGTLNVGYNGNSGSIQAGVITNNGTINFNNASGTLIIGAQFTGSGLVYQEGAGATVLSATTSAVNIGSIDAGTLQLASVPAPGNIPNNATLAFDSPLTLVIPNTMSGSGGYYFPGFLPIVFTGASSHTGQNQIRWAPVIVDNALAMGDTTSGSTAISGNDRIGGLYLSNNIVWSQALTLQTRQGGSAASATAPHLANFSGVNDVTGALTFADGGGGGNQINVEATSGQLTIDSTLANNANGTNTLNLQGTATGIWNGALSEAGGTQILNVLKRGSGTWFLNGANTYSGLTTVSNGTLGGIGTIAGPVVVTVGGNLAPGAGIGTLTISSDLTLGGTFTAEVNSTNAQTADLVAGLTSVNYAGTLVVSNKGPALTAANTFQLFSSAAYAGAFSTISPATPGTGLLWNTNTLATDGVLRIALSVATNPTNIIAVVNGGNLELSWPADHTGWTLQAQTNSLSSGLGTNWVNVPGSTSVRSVTNTISPANGSVFYRLKL